MLKRSKRKLPCVKRTKKEPVLETNTIYEKQKLIVDIEDEDDSDEEITIPSIRPKLLFHKGSSLREAQLQECTMNGFPQMSVVGLPTGKEQAKTVLMSLIVVIKVNFQLLKYVHRNPKHQT